MEDKKNKKGGSPSSARRTQSAGAPLESVGYFFAAMDGAGTEPVSEAAGEGVDEPSVSAEAVKSSSGAASSSRRVRRPSGGSSPRPSSVSVSPDVMAALSLFVRMYNASNPGARVGVREFVDRALVKSMKKTSPDVYGKVSEFLEGNRDAEK